MSEAREPRSQERLSGMVAEHFDMVWRLLRRLGVPATGLEDAAQEVFVVASRNIDDIRVGSEKSYLFGTALRVAKGVRRRAGREQGVPLSDNQPASQKNPEQLLDARRRLEWLDQALATLESAEREVFVLFELEGSTLTEISELLDLPRGTVASRLRRARTRFVRALRAHRGHDV